MRRRRRTRSTFSARTRSGSRVAYPPRSRQKLGSSRAARAPHARPARVGVRVARIFASMALEAAPRLPRLGAIKRRWGGLRFLVGTAWPDGRWDGRPRGRSWADARRPPGMPRPVRGTTPPTKPRVQAVTTKVGKSSEAAAFCKELLPNCTSLKTHAPNSLCFQFEPGAVQISEVFDRFSARPDSAGVAEWALHQASMEEVFLLIAHRAAEAHAAATSKAKDGAVDV